MESRFYRFPDLEQRVGLSRTTIWRLEKDGKFPARRMLSPNTVGWDQREVEEWMESRERAGVSKGNRRVQ